MSSPSPRILTIVKRKRPVGVRSWLAYELGEDENGRWAFTPAHSIHRGEDESGTAYCEVAERWRGGPGRDSVVLLPRDQWWIATWSRDGSLRCSADIATPPRRVDDVWAFDDLELDPHLTHDGDYVVEDEDEFAAACANGTIGPAEALAAREAVLTLRRALVADGPFVRAGETELERGTRLHLPSLPAPPP